MSNRQQQTGLGKTEHIVLVVKDRKDRIKLLNDEMILFYRIRILER